MTNHTQVALDLHATLLKVEAQLKEEQAIVDEIEEMHYVKGVCSRVPGIGWIPCRACRQAQARRAAKTAEQEKASDQPAS